MIALIQELTNYCINSAQAGLSLNTCVYDDEFNPHGGSIYDDILHNLYKVDIFSCKSEAIEFVQRVIDLVLLNKNSMPRLYYWDYCNAVCCILGKIDYTYLLKGYSGEVNYDFYKICEKEGLVYNRSVYVTGAKSTLGLLVANQGIHQNSSSLQYIAKKVCDTKRDLDNVGLSINGETILTFNFPTRAEIEHDENTILLNLLLSDDLFRDEISLKLPQDIREVLASRGKCNVKKYKTKLAFYVQAIKAQYGNKLGVDIKDALFELPLGISKNALCKKRTIHWQSKNPEECSWMLELKERFPDYDPKADPRKRNKFK